MPGWLEKCWLSAQSSGLEGAGRTHRCEGGPVGEKQGEDRLRQGAQEDTGSDTPVRGAGKDACLPGQGREAMRDPGGDGVSCGRAFAPTILPGMAREEGGSGAGMSGKRRSRSPDDGRRMTEKGTAPTGLSSNGPLVVPTGEARGPAAGGSDAARVPPRAAPHGPRRR